MRKGTTKFDNSPYSSTAGYPRPSGLDTWGHYQTGSTNSHLDVVPYAANDHIWPPAAEVRQGLGLQPRQGLQGTPASWPACRSSSPLVPPLASAPSFSPDGYWQPIPMYGQPSRPPILLNASPIHSNWRLLAVHASARAHLAANRSHTRGGP